MLAPVRRAAARAAAWLSKASTQAVDMSTLTPPVNTAPAEPPSPWQPLPGNVLELGATGFQIQLDVSPHRPLYTLRAPEGWIVAAGGDLPGLKQAGERFARERTEFVCKPIEVRR